MWLGKVKINGEEIFLLCMVEATFDRILTNHPEKVKLLWELAVRNGETFQIPEGSNGIVINGRFCYGFRKHPWEKYYIDLPNGRLRERERFQKMFPSIEVEDPEDFEYIARRLLSRGVLRIGSVTYRILEIEFYLYNEEHPDPYCHCHALQKESNVFYFHPGGGTRQGLDLTIGKENVYGGILLRTIQQVIEKKVFNGPSLTVDELVEKIPNVKTEYQGKNIFVDPLFSISFMNDVFDEEEVIWQSPRIGLLPPRNDSTTPAWEKFLAKPYRFLINSKAIKKGKAQTIFGLKHLPATDIASKTGSSLLTVQKHLALFETEPSGGKMDNYELCSIIGSCARKM